MDRDGKERRGVGKRGCKMEKERCMYRRVLIMEGRFTGVLHR